MGDDLASNPETFGAGHVPEIDGPPDFSGHPDNFHMNPRFRPDQRWAGTPFTLDELGYTGRGIVDLFGIEGLMPWATGVRGQFFLLNQYSFDQTPMRHEWREVESDRLPETRVVEVGDGMCQQQRLLIERRERGVWRAVLQRWELRATDLKLQAWLERQGPGGGKTAAALAVGTGARVLEKAGAGSLASGAAAVFTGLMAGTATGTWITMQAGDEWWYGVTATKVIAQGWVPVARYWTDNEATKDERRSWVDVGAPYPCPATTNEGADGFDNSDDESPGFQAGPPPLTGDEESEPDPPADAPPPSGGGVPPWFWYLVAFVIAVVLAFGWVLLVNGGDSSDDVAVGDGPDSTPTTADPSNTDAGGTDDADDEASDGDTDRAFGGGPSDVGVQVEVLVIEGEHFYRYMLDETTNPETPPGYACDDYAVHLRPEHPVARSFDRPDVAIPDPDPGGCGFGRTVAFTTNGYVVNEENSVIEPEFPRLKFTARVIGDWCFFVLEDLADSGGSNRAVENLCERNPFQG